MKDALFDSVPRLALALLVALGAAGCTGGVVTYNGSSVHAHSRMIYSVEFVSLSVPGATYLSQVTWDAPSYVGTATFSFDPTGPATLAGPYEPGPGASNSQTVIPAGEYTAWVFVYAVGEALPLATYRSQPFQHSVPSSGTMLDDYTGKSIQTRLYNFEILGQVSSCPLATAGATLTTVPLCGTSSNGSQPPSDFF